MPSIDEIKHCLDELPKASSADRMPRVFFKSYSYWSITEPWVIQFVQAFFRRGTLLRSMNLTNLVLIQLPSLQEQLVLTGFNLSV